MNKTLKVLPIVLAAFIVMLGISIPVLASGSKKDKNDAGVKIEAQADVAAQDYAESADVIKTVDSSNTVTTADSGILKAEGTEAVEEEKEDSSKGSRALAAAIVVGIAAAAGAIAMGIAIAKSAEGISRQPEAAGNIRTSLMLGLVFIETAIIYALIVAILIIFVM